MNKIFLCLLIISANISTLSHAYVKPPFNGSSRDDCVLRRAYTDYARQQNKIYLYPIIEGNLVIQNDGKESFKNCLADAANLVMSETRIGGDVQKHTNSSEIEFKGRRFLLIETTGFTEGTKPEQDEKW